MGPFDSCVKEPDPQALHCATDHTMRSPLDASTYARNGSLRSSFSGWTLCLSIKVALAGGCDADGASSDGAQTARRRRRHTPKSVQTIKNVPMNKTVDFTIDLKGQVQNEAMWLIEVPSGSSVRPAEDTVWRQNVLTFSQPVTSCQPRSRGSADYFSAPTLSTDGLHCCWDKIILKANRSATP